MNVLFSSDNNYAQHLGVAIYSLLSNNCEEDEITLYIVDNEIQQENKNRLEEIVSVFANATIFFVSFSKWKKTLQLDMSWPIALSAYARLFVASLLPLSVKKLLYLDCDVVITSTLHQLWCTEMNGKVIAAVQDTVSDEVKVSVGIQSDERYFNSGVLLIDLESWRKDKCEQKCLDFINERNGRVIHHDQGVLNGVFHNSWIQLPIKYNVMTIHYFFDLRKINKYFQNHSAFYTETEIAEAKNRPAILHFTPSFTSRPWYESCKHPFRNLYWDNLVLTPWREYTPQKDQDKWIVKLINWRYRNLPY